MYTTFLIRFMAREGILSLVYGEVYVLGLINIHYNNDQVHVIKNMLNSFN